MVGVSPGKLLGLTFSGRRLIDTAIPEVTLKEGSES